jgi:hypothetical protein
LQAILAGRVLTAQSTAAATIIRRAVRELAFATIASKIARENFVRSVRLEVMEMQQLAAASNAFAMDMLTIVQACAIRKLASAFVWTTQKAKIVNCVHRAIMAIQKMAIAAICNVNRGQF